jgi:hypothetical protein
MFVKDWQVHVPLIYVRTRGIKESWSLVGANVHDRLVVINDGAFLLYSNMQTCENSASEDGYEFHGEPDFIDEFGTVEYKIRMVPWPEAIKIYKKHDKSYRRFFRLMKNAAKKVIKVGRGNSKPLETTRDILEELENEERQ